MYATHVTAGIGVAYSAIIIPSHQTANTIIAGHAAY